MIGTGIGHGAATIVNAIAAGRGAAFGIDLVTTARVELTPGSGIDVVLEGFEGEDDALARKCVAAALKRYAPNKRFHASVSTRSDIPVSRGLKSSSAAANAMISATLDALQLSADPLDMVRLGTKAAVDAGVSVTGAFDDACASMLGGLTLTDNRDDTLLSRVMMPRDVKVVLDIPDRQIRKGGLPLDRMRAMAPMADLAFTLAMDGRREEAMTLNGMWVSAALGLDQSAAADALANGALAAGVTGTGPATAMLVREDHVKEFLESMPDRQLAVLDVWNGDAR